MPTRGHGFHRKRGITTSTNEDVNALGSQIVREIVIPELTKEVNEGKNFSQLRQVYNSLILATWYKKKIKDSILEQVYADKNKIKGLSSPNLLVGDPAKGDIEAIYQRYLQAFKKGVYNYIKEDMDPVTQETVPRKYFSGGVDLAMNGVTNLNFKMQFVPSLRNSDTVGEANDVLVSTDLAMASLYKRNLSQLPVFPFVKQRAKKVVKPKIIPVSFPEYSEPPVEKRPAAFFNPKIMELNPSQKTILQLWDAFLAKRKKKGDLAMITPEFSKALEGSLLANPAEVNVLSPSRQFSLGPFTGQDGGIYNINALEKFYMDHERKACRISFAFTQENEGVIFDNHNFVNMSLSSDGKTWIIDRFQPFSMDSGEKRIYGGTKVADRILKYMMDAVRLSNRELGEQGWFDFRVNGLFLRMAQQKEAWPVNMRIAGQDRKVDDILGKFFDFDIVGSVTIRKPGSEIIAEVLDLKALGQDSYKITAINEDQWGENKLTVGNKIIISSDGTWFDQEGNRLGVVAHIDHSIRFLPGWRDLAMKSEGMPTLVPPQKEPYINILERENPSSRFTKGNSYNITGPLRYVEVYRILSDFMNKQKKGLSASPLRALILGPGYEGSPGISPQGIEFEAVLGSIKKPVEMVYMDTNQGVADSLSNPSRYRIQYRINYTSLIGVSEEDKNDPDYISVAKILAPLLTDSKNGKSVSWKDLLSPSMDRRNVILLLIPKSYAETLKLMSFQDNFKILNMVLIPKFS